MNDVAAREPSPAAVSAIATILPGSDRATLADVLEARRALGRVMADTTGPVVDAADFDTPDEGPLKVGCLSLFFADRCWMKPVWGLINRHDRTQIEVHLFFDAPREAVRWGYAEAPRDCYHDICGLSNRETAARIRECGVSIFVDLNGYSSLPRLQLLALRPAPVVVAWFGMFTPAVLDVWARILRDTHGTRMVIKNRALWSVRNCDYLLARFVNRGVTAERIELEGPAEHVESLRNYDDIDIALDSFPYNAATTTTEALWQGVPVLTFYGDRWVSRTSATLLRSGNLAEWVAPDVDSFVQQAVCLAADPEAANSLARGPRYLFDRGPSMPSSGRGIAGAGPRAEAGAMAVVVLSAPPRQF